MDVDLHRAYGSALGWRIGDSGGLRVGAIVSRLWLWIFDSLSRETCGSRASRGASLKRRWPRGRASRNNISASLSEAAETRRCWLWPN